ALDLEAPHAIWWTNLAALYWQDGQQADAIHAMQQAIDIAPDAPDLWLNLGVFYEASGQPESARAAYRQMLELEPTWGQAAFWDETPLRRDVIAAAPVELAPYDQALALWQADERDAAREVLQAEIDRDPAQPFPYVHLARLYVVAGELGRAEDHLAAAELFVHTDEGRAWIAYVESAIATVRGDADLAAEKLTLTRELYLPDATGQPIEYGRDIARYQFLSLTVRGALLPQVQTFSPDPALLDLLQDQ
ncbi:MAG: tetratricopeptide repeat protein, partial [Chloroflexi bacterium]|nr:tetratricopeptide repeat protein [Chloroflexota bacterium]